MTNRYEQEIEEILRNAGEPAPAEPGQDEEKPADDDRRPRRQPRLQPAAYARGSSLPRITPGRVLLAGLLLLLVAVLLKVTPLVWLGLALVAVGYVGHFMRPRSTSAGQYWRGQPLETAPPSAWQRFKHWMGSKRQD